MRLYAVGLCRGGSFPDVVWDLVGVFSTHEKAEIACKDRRYCVMPIELDKDYGDVPAFSDGDYFPKSDVN